MPGFSKRASRLVLLGILAGAGSRTASAEPPPTPVWVHDDATQTGDVEVETLVEVVEDAEGPGDDAAGECNSARETPIVDWVDVVSAELSTPTQADTRLYLVVTARAGDEVFHWVQGPYGADGDEVRLQVSPPAEVVEAVSASTRPGTLRARLVTQDVFGVSVGDDPLETLVLSVDGGSPSYGLLRHVEQVIDPETASIRTDL